MASDMDMKLTLESKKVVVLRTMQIKHYRQAALSAENLVGKKSGEATFQIAMGESLLKLLIISVGGNKPSASEKEDLDKYFTVAEYNDVMEVMLELVGKSKTKPKIEMVPSS